MITRGALAEATVTTLTTLSLTAVGAGMGWCCGMVIDFMDWILSNCKKKSNQWTIGLPTVAGAGLGFFAGLTIGPAIYKTAETVGEQAIGLILKKA